MSFCLFCEHRRALSFALPEHSPRQLYAQSVSVPEHLSACRLQLTNAAAMQALGSRGRAFLCGSSNSSSVLQQQRARYPPAAICQANPQDDERSTSDNAQDSIQGNSSTRRALLRSAVLLAVPGLLTVQQQAAASRKTLQQDPRLQPLQQFWATLVAELQQQLSASFAPALVFYGPAELLPSGAPGDPALEYDRQARRSCGSFTSGFSQPYAVCPSVPGGLPASDAARDCCRHFAYCVPRSRYAFAAIDRQSSVVASPRLALAEPDTWQGVLVHEMGHCIDFHVFGERYRLPAEAPPRSASAAAALAAIDAAEDEAELRADRMANALLVAMLGGKHLCYSVQTHVQRLVPASVACLQEEEEAAVNSSSSNESLFMEHFPHPPVSA